jgi:hypothetical protein
MKLMKIAELVPALLKYYFIISCHMLSLIAIFKADSLDCDNRCPGEAGHSPVPPLLGHPRGVGRHPQQQGQLAFNSRNS